MSTIAIVNYIRFKQKGGAYLNKNYQNFFIGKSSTYDGVAYPFAPFAFNSQSATRGGERSDCALVLPLNDISVNLAQEMAEDNRLLEAKSVEIDPDDYSQVQLINTEIWRVAGYETDFEKVVIRLQTPLDAVAALIPNRVLSEELVGALPFESNV